MEGNGVFSLQEKSTEMPDPVPRVGSSMRRKTVPASHVSFGILCLINQVGAIIGARGLVIKQIQQSTESRIRVESGFPGCKYRVIRVIGPVGSTSRVKLGVNNTNYENEKQEEEEEIEVSKAQEALIRVFEVLNDGVWAGTVSCKLLMEASHVGGEIFERIRKESDCEVELRTSLLPVRADSDDAMVEIEGNVLAVKKALVYVSSRVQACQIYKAGMVGNKSHDRAFEESMHRHSLPRPVEMNSHGYRLGKDDMCYLGTLPRSSNGISYNGRHRQIEAFPRGALHRYTEAVPCDALGRTMDKVSREALYRSSDGFHGDVSRQHRELDPRDSLHIGQDSFPADACHGVLKQSRENWFSQQRIDSLSHRSSVLDTHPHSITASPSRNHPVTIKQPLSAMEDDNQTLVFKLLCPAESVCGVIESLTYIKTLESVRGASIHVGDILPDCDECLITFTSAEIRKDRMPPAQAAIGYVFSRLLFQVVHNPKCISANDQIVQISGEIPTVKLAMYHVTSKLVGNFLRSSRSLYETRRIFPNRFSPTTRYPPNFVPRCTMDVNGISDHFSEDASQLWGSEDTFTDDISDYLSEDSSQLWGSESPFPNRFSPTAGYYQNFGQRSTMDQAPSQLRTSPVPGAPRGDCDGNGGLSSTMSDLGLGSEHNSSNIVTNMTVEIRVPENAGHFVFGEEGGRKRLDDLRQISGAIVVVHEPQLGTSDRIIAISGTLVEIQTAHKLLQAVIQIGACESMSVTGHWRIDF
ncbi:hypothetical protein AALP_AA8G088800 [Arabis alpina]|uniref:K Homology domain-containing protein n=1 Tax=Arabis alpina TaxID=50452 RepID=A0A087G5V6_ARAAL|nr:hypothetical protein AALP_AA8G088800 [Arabis alpina]